jgi:hypothetical protein
MASTPKHPPGRSNLFRPAKRGGLFVVRSRPVGLHLLLLLSGGLTFSQFEVVGGKHAKQASGRSVIGPFRYVQAVVSFRFIIFA